MVILCSNRGFFDILTRLRGSSFSILTIVFSWVFFDRKYIFSTFAQSIIRISLNKRLCEILRDSWKLLLHFVGGSRTSTRNNWHLDVPFFVTLSANVTLFCLPFDALHAPFFATRSTNSARLFTSRSFCRKPNNTTRTTKITEIVE